MSLLTAQILDENIVGVDIPTPPQKYLPRPFKVEDTVSPHFADISSIENWQRYGFREDLKRDYGFVRRQIKDIVVAKGYATTLSTVDDPSTITKVAGDRYTVGNSPIGDFAGKNGAIAEVLSDLTWRFRNAEDYGYFECTTEEKLIAITYNIGDLTDHENDPEIELTASEIQAINAEYHRDSVANRRYRAQWAQTIVYRDLPDYKGQVWAAMVFSPAGNLVENYIEAGLKGTIEDFRVTEPLPNPGVCDYLQSRSLFGGAGANPGLSSQTFPTRTGRTIASIVSEMYDVLVYGVYL